MLDLQCVLRSAIDQVLIALAVVDLGIARIPFVMCARKLKQNANYGMI